MEKPLKNRTVLIVEDDIVIATDVAALLTEAGCKAVLPTTSVASSLSALVHYVVDAAILDVNIQNEWVFPVAHALEGARTPFLFLTAYSPDSIPSEYRRKPFFQKPHVPAALVDAVMRLIEPEPAVKLATVDGESVSDAEREPQSETQQTVGKAPERKTRRPRKNGTIRVRQRNYLCL